MPEVPQLHRVKMARLESGEHFPLVLDATGIPLVSCIQYLLSKRVWAVTTLDGVARALAKIHDFLDARRIDLRDQVARGLVMDLDTAQALRDHLRRVGGRTLIIRPRNRSKPPNTVSIREWCRRLNWAFKYLSWLIRRLADDLKLESEQKKQIDREVELLDEILARPTVSEPELIRALAEEQRPIFLDAIRPGSPTNPFSSTLQLRNCALLLTYWGSGVRRSEVLGLQIKDLHFIEGEPFINLVRRPDDPADLRLRRPSVKTMPRSVPIPDEVYYALSAYIMGDRRRLERELRDDGRVEAARALANNPFIFVSRCGAPLSLSSVQKIFSTLRDALGTQLDVDLSPHVLRRTWNDRFSERCDMDPKLRMNEKEYRHHQMGWKPTSRQSERYAARSIRRGSSRAMRGDQSKLLADLKGRVSDGANKNST